jgi:alkylation response protein AidB-like acyl-CoA dehydrogenase
MKGRRAASNKILMDIAFTDAERSFRDEVDRFLVENLPDRLRIGARATPTVFAEPDLGGEWQQILYKKGWLAYFWPEEFGGTGWSPVQRYIFEKECALAHAPDLPVLSLKLLAPVLHRFGTPAQQARYLPKILSGEHYWCQGFSEASSGSDLASLKTRASRDGDTCSAWCAPPPVQRSRQGSAFCSSTCGSPASRCGRSRVWQATMR